MYCSDRTKCSKEMRSDDGATRLFSSTVRNASASNLTIQATKRTQSQRATLASVRNPPQANAEVLDKSLECQQTYIVRELIIADASARQKKNFVRWTGSWMEGEGKESWEWWFFLLNSTWSSEGQYLLPFWYSHRTTIIKLREPREGCILCRRYYLRPFHVWLVRKWALLHLYRVQTPLQW